MALDTSQRDIGSFIESLCRKAEDLGASEAVALSVDDIVLDERTRLKCLVPVCPDYGVNLMCPPNLPPISKFKEILSCYHKAILMKMLIPLSGVPRNSREKRGETSAPPTAEDMASVDSAQKKLHQVVNRVEALCFAAGYHFAAGFLGGTCCLCRKCVGISSGLPCRYPLKARPAMEAMGIDVVATVKKAGLQLSFGQDRDRSWVGLVLVD